MSVSPHKSSKSSSGYPLVKFGDVVRNVNDTERNPFSAGIERYVGLEHIEPVNLHIKSWGNVADGTSFTRKFVKGQVLFGKRRSYQRKVAVAEFDGICSSDILVFEPKDDTLIPELLPFIVQSEGFFYNALGTSVGSLSPRTKWTHLKEYTFPLPPKEEQRRIAEILWAADEVQAKYSELEAATVKACEAFAVGQIAEYLDTGAQFVELDDLCLLSAQSGVYKGPSYLGSGTKFVNMKELFANDLIDHSVQMERIELTDDELGRYTLTSNDLLFGRRSIVVEGAGKCSMVGTLGEPIAFESSILRVTIDSRKACPGFIFEWFNSPDGAREIARIRSFTTIAGITGSDLKKVRVPFVPLQQQEFLFEKIQSQRTKLEHIKKARSRLAKVGRALRETKLGG